MIGGEKSKQKEIKYREETNEEKRQTKNKRQTKIRKGRVGKWLRI